MSEYTIRLANQHSGFFDPITKLHLTYYHPIDKVDFLSDPINRGIRLRTLVLVSTEEDAQLQPMIIVPPDAGVVADAVVSDVVIIPPQIEVPVTTETPKIAADEDVHLDFGTIADAVLTEEVVVDEPKGEEEVAVPEEAAVTPEKSTKKNGK
jgi:hypothetical protein